MSISEKTGGKRLEKMPPLKEPKSSGLGREQFRLWLQGEEAWKVSNMPRNERTNLEQKLFGSEGFKSKKAEEVYKDIKNLPGKSKEKYGIKTERERNQIISILEESLKK